MSELQYNSGKWKWIDREPLGANDYYRNPREVHNGNNYLAFIVPKSVPDLENCYKRSEYYKKHSRPFYAYMQSEFLQN